MPFLTEKELMEKINVSRQTLLCWRKLGMPYMRPMKTLRYDFEEVIAWMKSRNKGS